MRLRTTHGPKLFSKFDLFINLGVFISSYDSQMAESEEHKLNYDDGRSKTFSFINFQKPQGLAFHLAWASLLISKFAWFSPGIIQGLVRRENEWLSIGNRFKNQNIVSVIATIIFKIVTGISFDLFGAKKTLSASMVIFGLPIILIGISRNFVFWTVSRFFIGGLGAVFPLSLSWMSELFSDNIIGIVVGILSDFDLIGGELAKLFIMPLSNLIGSWRLALIFPASLVLVFSLLLYFSGNLQIQDFKRKFNFKINDWQLIILALLYGVNSGFFLIFRSNLTNYLTGNNGLEYFSWTYENSNRFSNFLDIISIFSFILGGTVSDFLMKKFGHRGRTSFFFFIQSSQALFLFLTFFAVGSGSGLIAALVLIVLYVLFSRMAQVCALSIVPYNRMSRYGTSFGIVSAFQNIVAFSYGFQVIFKIPNGLTRSFLKMGILDLGVSFFGLLLVYFSKN